MGDDLLDQEQDGKYSSQVDVIFPDPDPRSGVAQAAQPKQISLPRYHGQAPVGSPPAQVWLPAKTPPLGISRFEPKVLSKKIGGLDVATVNQASYKETVNTLIHLHKTVSACLSTLETKTMEMEIDGKNPSFLGAANFLLEPGKKTVSPNHPSTQIGINFGNELNKRYLDESSGASLVEPLQKVYLDSVQKLFQRQLKEGGITKNPKGELMKDGNPLAPLNRGLELAAATRAVCEILKDYLPSIEKILIMPIVTNPIQRSSIIANVKNANTLGNVDGKIKEIRLALQGRHGDISDTATRTGGWVTQDGATAPTGEYPIGDRKKK